MKEEGERGGEKKEKREEGERKKKPSYIIITVDKNKTFH